VSVSDPKPCFQTGFARRACAKCAEYPAVVHIPTIARRAAAAIRIQGRSDRLKGSWHHTPTGHAMVAPELPGRLREHYRYSLLTLRKQRPGFHQGAKTLASDRADTRHVWETGGNRWVGTNGGFL
jgi:hypothetical protein